MYKGHYNTSSIDSPAQVHVYPEEPSPMQILLGIIHPSPNRRGNLSRNHDIPPDLPANFS